MCWPLLHSSKGLELLRDQELLEEVTGLLGVLVFPADDRPLPIMVGFEALSAPRMNRKADPGFSAFSFIRLVKCRHSGLYEAGFSRALMRFGLLDPKIGTRLCLEP